MELVDGALPQDRPRLERAGARVSSRLGWAGGAGRAELGGRSRAFGARRQGGGGAPASACWVQFVNFQLPSACWQAVPWAGCSTPSMTISMVISRQ